MPTHKTVLLIQVDLEVGPGTIRTPENAKTTIQNILTTSIPHYDPQVRTLPFADH